MDISEEIINTLLCYLEIYTQNKLTILGRSYIRCTITSYGGKKDLTDAAISFPPLASVIERQKLKSSKNFTLIEFDIIELATALALQPNSLKNQLKRLEWNSIDNTRKRSSISVEFSDLGFLVKSVGDLTEQGLDEILNIICNCVNTRENMELNQLEIVTSKFDAFAMPSVESALNYDNIIQLSENFKSMIREYLTKETFEYSKQNNFYQNVPSQSIIQDIYRIISLYPENKFTARAISRIFYGIASPNYPANVWGSCKFWRTYLRYNFETILETVKSELLKIKELK